MKTTMLKFPTCRSEAKRKKISLRDRLLGGFAKLIVFVDPAPTPVAADFPVVVRCVGFAIRHLLLS